MELSGKNVLVLGLGETGMSMARWLARRGAAVRVADSRDAPPNVERLARELPGVPLTRGAFRAASFEAVDMIAISPGVPVADPTVSAAARRGIPVVGDIELFARFKSAEAALIAITGSNGKSTVTSMVGEMCRAAGASVVVAGNIGLPVLDALTNLGVPKFYVLELSSFQLETTMSMDAAAATVLNLSEDHLDRYADMDAYAASKARIFQGTGVQILNRDDVRSLGMRLPGRRVITFGRDAPASASDWGIVRIADRTWLARGADAVMATAELGVPGTHNALNALAALALCDAVGLPLAPLAGALRAFGGLPHRMQLIAVQGDVRFYNDSKGTNVGASRAALEGLGSKCVLIAGGDGKGQDFRPLVEPVRANARAVVLIGRDSAKIEAALRASGVPLSHANDLKEAVERAYLAARPGDAVLLSPACASYDMFRDYRHRGDEFTRIARSLGATPGGPH